MMPRWRNWYTRKIEVLMPQGLEVQILSWAPKNDEPQRKLRLMVFNVVCYNLTTWRP